MIKTLNLTKHAVERLMGRFGMNVATTKMNMDTADWVMTRRTNHNITGDLIEYYAYTAGKVRMVMVVAVDSSTVLTVMSEGHMVDACYAYVARAKATVR